MLEQPKRNSWHSFLSESRLIRSLIWENRRLFALGSLSIFLVDIADLCLPLILKYVIDLLVDQPKLEQKQMLLWLALGFFAVSAVQAIGRYFWRLYIFDAAARAGHTLRERFIRKLFSIPPSQFDRLSTGKLMSLATNDIEAVRNSIGSGSVTLIDAMFYLAIIPFTMWNLSPELTMVALIPMPLIPIYVFWARHRIQERFDQVQKEFSEISALAQENFAGIRTIKGLSSEVEHANQFNHYSQVFLEKNIHLSRIQSALAPTLDFIMSSSLVLLIYVGSTHVLDQSITIGTWIAFQRYIQKMIWPLMALAMSVNFYQRGVASSKRLIAFFAEQDLPENHQIPGPLAQRGRIEFRGLTFDYPSNKSGPSRPALLNINLVIEPGERVALVGPIGSGKSTLLNLVPGLYPVQKGQLVIDGIDINEWNLKALRQSIGFVSQDIFLFNESIEDNIGVEQAKIWAPRLTTDAREWNMQNAVGERGARLSGGQRQRIALARALARNPSILLLDDAFSSVDTVTEEHILGQLESRQQRGTEIIAAHRIATLKHAHRVVVLHQGSIVQSGTHRELMQNKGGLYFQFYEYSVHGSV